MRRTVALLLLGVSLAPASGAMSAEAYAERLDAARRAAELGASDPSPEAMDRVRAELGLPAVVVLREMTVELPVDPVLADLDGRTAHDFEVASSQLDELRRALDEAMAAPPLDRTELASALDDAYRDGIQVRPTLLERVRRAIRELLQGLAYRLFTFGGGGTILAWVVLAALVVLGFLVIRRLRLVPGRTSESTDKRPRPSIDWRARADEAIRAGDLPAATHALYQSLLVTLSRRGVLIDRPGLTAGECRRAVRGTSPALEHAVSRATESFERVAYGGAMPRMADVELIGDAEAIARSA